jgi:predicted dehydrogenase
MKQRLGVGFIGGGFMTCLHLKAWAGVRDADVRGIWSPDRKHEEQALQLARSLRLGDVKAFGSLEEMVQAPEIDSIWMCGPNHYRLDNMRAIVQTLRSGRGHLRGIACEKPLGRNAAEAKRMVELVEEAGILHGYLENQVFSPPIARGKSIVWARGARLTGRPYLARAAEEHSGPHSAWFWRGDLQGGGVLNDMLCHSVEAVRFLLTDPAAPRSSVRPVKVSAQIACLKWGQPAYARWLIENMGPELDYTNRPAEDFARATITFLDDKNQMLIGEVTSSWSYVGPGLRLTVELLGPEYSMSTASLDTAMKVFFSRRVQGQAGQDLVEKQNAEQGLMPVVSNEAAEYGYEAEDRFFVRCFLDGVQPELDFRAGLEVAELLMAAYKSAEEERTVEFNPAELDCFTPAVAAGTWNHLRV